MPATRLRPYWLSWHSPGTAGPFEAVFPWWYTGPAPLDPSFSRTMCAAVMARNAGGAKAMVRASYGPPRRRLNWRFVMARDQGWSPFSDRFPREDWMQWPEG